MHKLHKNLVLKGVRELYNPGPPCYSMICLRPLKLGLKTQVVAGKKNVQGYQHGRGHLSYHFFMFTFSYTGPFLSLQCLCLSPSDPLPSSLSDSRPRPSVITHGACACDSYSQPLNPQKKRNNKAHVPRGARN